MVSIVIPTLNEASTIGLTLEHTMGVAGHFEVIVVDGGGGDGTAAIAERYATVLHGRRGRACQMNLGASEARGDILLFLHADTLLPAGAIHAVEKALERPGVVGGRFKVVLDDRRWPYRMIGWFINSRDRLFSGFTGDQAIFVRAEVFRALGGYGDMPLMEDLDFGKRMVRAGKVVRLPLKVTTSARRWQKNGVLKTILLMWLLRLLFVLRCPPSRLKRLYGDAR